MIREFLLFLSWWVDLKKWSNGVWPNNWWWFRILLPYQMRFYYPALKHDVDFSWWWTEEDKQIADIQFFERCLEESWKNIFAILFSCIYFIMVYYFWYRYFYYI